MADDHDALLARADGLVAWLNREPQPWWDDEHCLDNGQAAVVAGLLAAAVRDLLADRIAGLDVIARLTTGWDAHPTAWFRDSFEVEEGEPTCDVMSEREWRVFCDAAQRATRTTT